MSHVTIALLSPATTDTFVGVVDGLPPPPRHPPRNKAAVSAMMHKKNRFISNSILMTDAFYSSPNQTQRSIIHAADYDFGKASQLIL